MGESRESAPMPQSMTVGWLERLAAAALLASLAPLASVVAQTPTGSAAPAIDPFAAGDAARGATKATVCSACHGPNGNSTSPEWPRLAGQNAVYIVEQLRLFRSGVRDNPVMKPLASTLSDQ